MAEQKAKYEEIVDWIESRLDRGELKSGSKLDSENELVAIFGVSRQTVRHAISVLESKGVLEKRRGSGTYIKMPSKREKKRTPTKRIAIITTYVDEYIFPPMIRAMEEVLSNSGYALQIAFTHNAIERERLILKEILDNKSVDGIIAETTKSGIPNPNIGLYEKLMEQDIPVLFVNSFYRNLDAPHVSMNDKLAGKIVTEYLLQCGHRKIAGIFKSDDGQGHSRYAGYVEALMEADVKVRGDRIAWVDTEDVRVMLEDATRILARMKGCTACVCYNDEVAHKLVSICMEQGIRIPEDLSIIGIDNSDLAMLCEVPLTSAANPVKELGNIAALGILDMIAGKEVETVMERDPEIVVRNSVKLINELYS